MSDYGTDDELVQIELKRSRKIYNLKQVKRVRSLSSGSSRRLGLIMLRTGLAQSTSMLPACYKNIRPKPGYEINLGMDEDNIDRRFGMRRHTVIPIKIEDIGEFEIRLYKLAKALYIFDNYPPDKLKKAFDRTGKYKAAPALPVE